MQKGEKFMNSYKKAICILLIMAVVVLPACANTARDDTWPSEESTVENAFTIATPETTENDEQSTAPQTGYSGGISHGFADRSLTNEKGLCHLYTGGELHIHYGITTTGNLGDAGIGILLILDGEPQPYKTAEDDEYRYVHTFCPGAGEKMTVELILTPVTGKEGDTLELTAFHILNPDYYPDEQVIGMMQTNGSVRSSTQLVFQATPPAVQPMEETERIKSQTITYTDLTSDDIDGWSSEDLNREYSFAFTTDHAADAANIYGVSPGENLLVHTEVFGATAVRWSLMKT